MVMEDIKPKCKICNVDLTHEWLAGDYTLLLCDKEQCHEINDKVFDFNLIKEKTTEAKYFMCVDTATVLQISEGKDLETKILTLKQNII